MLKSMRDRRERENEAREAGRIPPGQSLTKKFPVLHYGPVPRFDPATWDFRVWGEVEAPLRWTWDEINQLPRTRVTMDLHCVTRWSKVDTLWEGISIRKLVEGGFIKPTPAAKYIIQHAEYGYTTNLPLEVYLQDNFLLATHYDGKPLDPEHGYPLRGVVGAIPGSSENKDVYLWKGAKWIRGLEFSPTDKPGFWEQAGYHNEADIWDEERFGRGW